MRYACSVLEEMRDCYKTYNFSPILSLIEEMQIMANRMESALGEKKSYFYWHDQHKEEEEKLTALKKVIGQQRKEIAELEGQKDKLEENIKEI